MTTRKSLALLAGAALLGACADKEVILTGERFALREPFYSVPADLAPEPAEEPAVETAFVAPAQVSSASWTHTAGTPAHLPGHAAFSAQPGLAWSVGIGQGNTRKHRITSDPVVADGRIFTLDSRSTVAAVSTAGAKLWSRDLTPASDRQNDASGGGVAVAGSRVFATTGFGEVVALDAASGAEIWRQRLEAPATAAPTVVEGLVYVVSRDNLASAIDAENGRVRWQLPGTPDVSGMIGGAAPAVTERVAIFPMGSGELVAALRQGGVRIWGTPVSGKRRGAAYANITDITADPVIADGVIYTGNQSGRAAAIDLSSGRRIWTARDGAYGPVAVAGNSVFLISDQADLIRLDAATGREIWSNELPYFRREKARRSKAIFAHFGPVLAGNRLWVASDDGTLRAYDPETGAERATLGIPGGAASSMAVAGGTMYLISGRGQLLAFR